MEEDDGGIRFWEEWQRNAVATAEECCLEQELEYIEWQMMCLLDDHSKIRARLCQIRGRG